MRRLIATTDAFQKPMTDERSQESTASHDTTRTPGRSSERAIERTVRVVDCRGDPQSSTAADPPVPLSVGLAVGIALSGLFLIGLFTVLGAV